MEPNGDEAYDVVRNQIDFSARLKRISWELNGFPASNTDDGQRGEPLCPLRQCGVLHATN
jgi:hypothetical protein